MIAAVLKPFITIWQAMVNYHRTHLADDPDVIELRRQQEQARLSNQRLNAVEREYLGRRQP